MAFVRRVANPWGKSSFILRLPPKARVLDVGCGNDSPRRTKALRPDLYYVGLDVRGYNQSELSIAKADQYILVSADEFAPAVVALGSNFHAVILAHNLEHCFDPDAVLQAMLNCLAPGGRMYLSFPCEESVAFPSRWGCLNFFDDPQHQSWLDYDRALRIIRTNGLGLTFATPRHRPPLMVALGLAVEPLSAARKRTMQGTWALYGFESVIWAER